MRMRTHAFLAGAALLSLAACGGGTSPVASTPTPPPVPGIAPPPSPPPSPTPTGFDTSDYNRSNAAIQAQALAAYQAGSTGAGVIAGVIDSGVNANSPEFSGRISASSGDFAGNRGLQDEGGHGTAVSDVLLGANNNSGIQGVAPNATLLVLRTDTPGSCAALDSSGNPKCTHRDTAIANGLDRATSVGARVVNISLGGEAAGPELRNAINRATAAGTIIVISAGNDGFNDPDVLAQVANDPIAHGLVLIAGGVDSQHILSIYVDRNGMVKGSSNKAGNSASHYLVALSSGVRSIDQNGGTFAFSGTSFSAPVVSGAVALLAQYYPAMTSVQIVDLLLRTATDLGASGIDGTYGQGEINITAAFQPQGQTSVSATAIPVSMTANAVLSSAMGDAGQGGLSATIRDGYGRDFAVDLAPTVRSATRSLRLANALRSGVRSGAAGVGGSAIALTVAGAGAEPLRMTAHDGAAARVLAGSMVSRVGRNTQIALGFSRSGAALVGAFGTGEAPPFLIGDAGSDSFGFDLSPAQSIALDRRIGNVGISFSADHGAVRLWRDPAQPAAPGRSVDHPYSTLAMSARAGAGPVFAKVRLTRLAERDTVLGATFADALGGGGAVTWFADFGASVRAGTKLRLSGTLRQGWTVLGRNPLRGGSVLRSSAMSFDLERSGLVDSRDTLALRWSRPLRVTGGAINLPGLDAGAALSLAPRGQEQDVEAVYGRMIGMGWLGANLFWRTQPGNIAATPQDIGSAIRYSVAF